MEVMRTLEFGRWLKGLRDRAAQAAIIRRIERLADGHLGDARPVGDGVSELRVHLGPGYRLYMMRRGDRLVVLLCGGDKASQPRDIARAKALAREWKE